MFVLVLMDFSFVPCKTKFHILSEGGFVAIELSYADVESVLAALHRVAPDKRVAFRARLKHFQRLGFPKGANTGTGKRVAYSVIMLFKLAFAMELTQIGMSPKRVVNLLDLNWHLCEGSIPRAITPRGQFERWDPPIDNNDFVWIFSPESLRDLAQGGEDDLDYYGSLRVIPMSELEGLLRFDEGPLLQNAEWAADMGQDWRQTIIVLRPFLISVMGLLIEARPELDLVDIWAETYTSLSDPVRNGLEHRLDPRLIRSGHDGNDT